PPRGRRRRPHNPRPGPVAFPLEPPPRGAVAHGPAGNGVLESEIGHASPESGVRYQGSGAKTKTTHVSTPDSVIAVIQNASSAHSRPRFRAGGLQRESRLAFASLDPRLRGLT